MQWIAPSEKDTANNTLEKRLWDAADQFRANSGLTAAQYSQPVLGLIFLRFAEVKFSTQRAKLDKAASSSRRGSRLDDPGAYHADGVLYLTANARFDHLALPEAADVGKVINEAMRDIEKNNSQLAGVLPKTYNLFTSTLLKELLKKVSEIPSTLDYDAFGRIYEYFLGEFAMTEGQGGGEFYTPSAIVRLLTEVIEPYHGRILDPACGSGGMFVSSARFVSEHKKNPSSELSIHGVEKTDETGRLCRMNLAVHGLEGEIRHGGNVNSYYDDPHDATGKFDFVLANPPFNVNAVDKERLKDSVGPRRRFPFGLPRTDNANYLWIQLFYSTLNDKGRAGFVMANSASDARSSEQELRENLIKARAVDVMVAVGPNLFYTVTLPCTLWFLDKRKTKTPRSDTVLFIDARHIYRQIDRAHREWTPAQISFLANVARLYRGEELDFTLGGEEAQAKLKEVFGKKPKFTDVPGLCKAATLKEIEAQGWSLNPGRYVGVAPGGAVTDEDFKEQLETLNEELETLNAQALSLEKTIARNVAQISGGVTMVWPTKKLGELADICRGSSPRPICDTKYFEDGTVPWVKIADATKSGKFLYETKEHVNDYGASFSRRLPPGTILVAASGTLGYTQILGVEGCAHDGWLILQNLENLDRDFAYYALKTLERHFFNSGSGAAIQNINTDILRQTEIPYPPVAVQERIACVLSAYDDLLENNRRRIRILEETARALYREWFIHFRFPGHEKIKCVDSPLGSIPQGWSVKPLRELTSKIGSGATPRGGKGAYKTDGINLIRSLNIYDYCFEHTDLAFIDDEQARQLENVTIEKYDILLNITGASVGRCCMVPSHLLPARVNQHVAIVRVAAARANPFYVLDVINSDSRKAQLLSLAQGGATREALTKETISNFELVLPPKALLDQYATFTAPLHEQREVLYLQSDNLRRTRDLLLPRLLSGQLHLEAD